MINLASQIKINYFFLVMYSKNSFYFNLILVFVGCLGYVIYTDEK